MPEVITDYLALGLRLGRLVDGFVDCWFGDHLIAQQVDAEPTPDPAALIKQAADLLNRLPDSDLDDDRRRFLAAQLRALECTARRLAGEEIGFAAEVRAYFDVEVTTGDPDTYADAHRDLAELLPGHEPLRTRLEAYYARIRIPPDKLLKTVQTVSDQMAVRTRRLFGIPATDHVEYELVSDKPWNAFNRYLGALRSNVALNSEAGGAIAALPTLVTHESYPGHHTEHCVKEAELVCGRGQYEHVISLVNTPQCLISEGMAEMALPAVMADGWGPWTSELLAAEGVFLDGDLVERVHGRLKCLFPVRQDAAIMLHEQGKDPDDVVEHLRRWLLLPRDRARHMVSFLMDPLWRAYTVTYVEGTRLVGEWLAAGPVAERYRRLLAESPTPSKLQAEVTGHR